jgi:hypothetical protein
MIRMIGFHQTSRIFHRGSGSPLLQRAAPAQVDSANLAPQGVQKTVMIVMIVSG